MKWLLLIAWLTFPASLTAQQRTYTFTETNSSPRVGHFSANEFERIMEQALQRNYPSRTENCSVMIELATRKVVQYFKFTWSCDVVRSIPSLADYHFTRRGTIQSGPTIRAARQKVWQELSDSDKVDRVTDSMEKSYGFAKRQTSRSTAGPDNQGQYWYLEETFITTNKGR
jgi:hypothetical protein